MASGPVPSLPGFAPPHADSVVVDSVTWYEAVEAAEVEALATPPSELACADIVVYGPTDALTLPVYNQIVADAPALRVRRILAPWNPNLGGWDGSAQACRNAIASVVAANLAWNEYCSGSPCRSYPVEPGPELYIVGDSYIVKKYDFMTPIFVPVGIGTATAGSWQLACTRDCRSDLLIYDLDGDGVPNGPVSRIPATTEAQASNAAAASRDVNIGRNVDPGWHVGYLAGSTHGDPHEAVPTLSTIRDYFDEMQYAARPILNEDNFPLSFVGQDSTLWAPQYDAFDVQVNAGLREVFGYGGMTGIVAVNGRFINTLGAYNSGRLASKTRLVGWWPGCNLHASWYNRSSSDISTIRKLMLADTTRAMMAASVSHMDIGWFGGHQAMTLALGLARRAAGEVGARRSVARVAYDAVVAAGENGDLEARRHALSLSTWGSYTLVGRGAVPYEVEDLGALTGRTNAAISWTEPYQENGAADEYEIRYQAFTPLTEATFVSNGGTLVGSPPTPGAGGTPHCVEIEGLASCRVYYFAMRTKADGVWSAISNVATATTKCSGFTFAMCGSEGLLGGGGGGESSRKGESYATQTHTPEFADNGETEQSLLQGLPGVPVVDVCRMERLGLAGGVAPTVHLRQTGARRAVLERVALGYVERPEGMVAVASGDSVLVGALRPVESVMDGDGRVMSDLRDENATWLGKAGESLVIEVPVTRGRTALVFESKHGTGSATTDSLGIDVQVLGGSEGWETLRKVYPRRAFDLVAVPIASGAQVRVSVPREYSVRALASMAIMDVVVPTPLPVVSARHSRLGSLDEVMRTGRESIELAASDSLTIDFMPEATGLGGPRDYFLTVEGSYEITGSRAAGGVDELLASSPVAWSFALAPAYPNPGSGRVVLAYSLAEPCRADLKVYDVAGRLVRTLVAADQEAGPHEVLWDGRDSAGRGVAAGVYFYRLAAGGWRSERKVVLLRK